MMTATSANSQFEMHNYFDFPIIVNKEDGYVNATKLCDVITIKGKRERLFRNYVRSKDWNETLVHYEKEFGVPMHYTLMKGVNKNMYGHYVHPELVHFVAHWASIEYSAKVAKVMKAIHERNQLAGHDTTNEVITKLREENEALKQKLIDSGVQIAELGMRAVPEEHKDAYMILINEDDDKVAGKYRVTKRVMRSLNRKEIRELEETAIIKRLHLPIGLSFVKDMAKELGLTYKKNHFIGVTDENLEQIQQYLDTIPREQ